MSWRASARAFLNRALSICWMKSGSPAAYTARPRSRWRRDCLRRKAEHIVWTGVRIGAHLLAYCSATGRVLLSQFSDKDVLERLGRKRLPARTPRTLTKPNEIVTEIRSVREKGYAISDEELEVGLRSLAVPVAGSTGEIIAAVSVSASSARVRAIDLSKRFFPILQSCARMLVEAANEVN
jgi:IclR family pca regulon transcriptional regulator